MSHQKKESRYEVPETRTEWQLWFDKFFGPLIALIDKSLIYAHLLSFIMGVGAINSAITGNVADLGLYATGFAVTLLYCLSVGVGLGLETLHHYIPISFFWCIFQIKQIIKSPLSVLMFLLLGGIGYGLTVLSYKTSATGGEQYAESFKKLPAPTDISNLAQSYRRDSAAIANGYELRELAIDQGLSGESSLISADYATTIAVLKKSIKDHYALDRSLHPWAPGVARQKEALLVKVESEKQAKLAAIRSKALIKKGSLQTELSSKLSPIDSSFTARKEAITQSDEVAFALANKANNNLKDIGYKIGFLAVMYLLIASFLKEGYHFARGARYKGFSFEQSVWLENAIDSIKGIFTDKGNHLNNRLSATRDHLKTREEAKPFALPSSRFLLVSLSTIGIAFFVSQTVAHSASAFSEMSIIPFPYNWTGLIVMIIVLGFSVKKEAGARVGTDATRIDTDDTRHEDKEGPFDTNSDTNTRVDTSDTFIDTEAPISTPESPETRVPRDDTDDTDTDELATTPEEITKLKKACRRNFECISTAATQAGRASAKDKFKSRKDRLTSLGYKVRVSNPERRIMVKRNGSPVEIKVKTLYVE